MTMTGKTTKRKVLKIKLAFYDRVTLTLDVKDKQNNDDHGVGDLDVGDDENKAILTLVVMDKHSHRLFLIWKIPPLSATLINKVRLIQSLDNT